MAVSFVSVLGYGVQRAILPAHLKEMGLGVGRVGFIISLYGVPRALMNVVGGQLSDRCSRKWNLVAGVGLYALAYAALALAAGELGVALSRVAMGMGLSWGTTAAMAVLAARSSESHRGTVFGVQKACYWSGIFLSGLAATRLWGRVGFGPMMLSCAGLGLGAAALTAAVLPEPPSARTRGRAWPARELRSLLAPSFLALHGVGLVCKLLEDGVVIVVLPLLFIHAGLGRPEQAGLLVAAYTATFAAGQPAGGGLADRWGRLRTIAVGHGLSFLSLVPVLVVRHPLTLFGAAVGLGLGTALVSPSAEVLSGELVAPTLTATSMGLWRFFRDLGSFLGPVVLGAVWSQFGPQAALATALGTVVLAQAGASRLRTPAATGL